jgi:hypothetical protein
MSKARQEIYYVVQSALSDGLEWQPWDDMLGPGTASDDLMGAIHKAELYHHFMLHGVYPEPYNSKAAANGELMAVQIVRNVVLAAQAQRKFKVRTRIVKRTITIVDEEADAPMIIKHGAQT